MAEPTRPGEIPDNTSLARLVECRDRHAAALFGHRSGLSPLTDQRRAGHALAELAYSHALAERVLFDRWVVAVEALEAGKSHDQVATAMGLEVGELVAGLRSWAAGQLRHGLIDGQKHAQVLALLGEPPATADPMDQLPTWQLRRLVQLIDALGDPPLTLAERASLIVLAGQEQATVDNLAGVIRRVLREAAHPGDRALGELVRQLDELNADTPDGES